VSRVLKDFLRLKSALHLQAMYQSLGFLGLMPDAGGNYPFASVFLKTIYLYFTKFTQYIK